MTKKIPILLLTKDRPNLLEKVLARVIRFTDWNKFEFWILDNLSSSSNRKIIRMFKDRYPHINVYSSTYNQLALIQNEVIERLKADYYIKIDDDILVSENWTDGFTGVYERNYKTMCFGSVIIPINGFGWVPFLEIMNLTEKFKAEFPEEALRQDCYNVPVYNNAKANEFIWNNCLAIDNTAKVFVSNQQGNFKDLICPHRYSIGAIVFSHQRWQEMGGWKVQAGYNNVLKNQQRLNNVANFINKARQRESQSTKWNDIANMISNAHQGELGIEEEEVFNYSIEKGLTIPVTTQGIVFHFSFGPVDQYLMNKVYHKIKF